jgi:hypothetical protein
MASRARVNSLDGKEITTVARPGGHLKGTAAEVAQGAVAAARGVTVAGKRAPVNTAATPRHIMIGKNV